MLKVREVGFQKPEIAVEVFLLHGSAESLGCYSLLVYGIFGKGVAAGRGFANRVGAFPLEKGGTEAVLRRAPQPQPGLLCFFGAGAVGLAVEEGGVGGGVIKIFLVKFESNSLLFLIRKIPADLRSIQIQ